MIHFAKPLSLSACALAAAVLLSACGGGESTDKVLPTLTITDSEATAIATGAVTFTFTFSEEVKGFTVEDIAVTGGTPGALTKVDATHYTLVVTPAANASGTITVSVAAAKYADLANNGNVQVASASQDFNTAATIQSGDTGTCTAAPCISFAEAAVAFEPFEGLASAAIDNDPVSGTNKVAKLVKAAAGQPWAGATIFTTAGNKSVAAIDLSGSKVITLRVYSPAAGEAIMLKLEDASDSNKYLEKQVVTTKANAWETLSFDYASPSNGSYNAATTYNKISLFPGFMTQVDKTYYFDELKYTVKAAPTVAPLIFASGYTALADPSSVGYAYQGSSTQGGFFNWMVANGDVYPWGIDGWYGVASGDLIPNFYWGGPGKVDQDYMASWVNAPGNTPLQLSGQTKLRITVWGNNELVGAPRFTPVIQLADTNGCYPRAEASPLTPTSAGADNATYNIALSSFTVVENCGTAMTTAEFMAKPLGSVHVRIYKANYYNPGNTFSSPNGINMGPISFQP